VSAQKIADIFKKSVGVDFSSEFGEAAVIDLARCRDCDLSFFIPAIAGSPDFYEKLQQFPWYYPDHKAEFAFAGTFVKSDDAVIEVGCGRGAFASTISTRNYIGLEYTQKSVNEAQERGLDVRNMSLQTYALDHRESADVVCMFQVLEHVPDVRPFLESAVACLKKGGRLIVSVPSADSFLRQAVNNVLNMPPHHVTWWSNRSLDKIATLFGLQIEAKEHEILADSHVNGYAHTLVLVSLDRILGRETKLIDTSILDKIRSRLAVALGNFLAKGLLAEHMRPLGHSVTYVYRKVA
jgi:SAM-dependent methyltransferase